MNGFAKMRIKAKLAQEATAAALNVDRSTVAKWETGVAKPRADKLISIANLYNCEIADLLSDDSGPTPTEEAV
ncbi:MAG: helix-turn-helix transcriptional regulator [Clostridia bacterium]|nr:helix-turn-helix transcriptional regulator [Clostridia bacterium]